MYKGSDTFTENKLAEYDLAICRAFAYKLQSHTSDRNFKKIPYAFPATPSLPSLHNIRSRVATLSGIEPEIYHCCVNSCVCYVGAHDSLDKCPFCKEPRYRADGRPRKTFAYIPLIPRLRSFFTNSNLAEKMQYRHQYITGQLGESSSEPNKVKDVFDGKDYKELIGKNVIVGDETLQHKYFDDKRDIAFGLSTDGFGPFKRRTHT
ncbi:hypothetical protein K435DRAFT_670900, partial [Dendrothele bispora CBS 962.96]